MVSTQGIVFHLQGFLFLELSNRTRMQLVSYSLLIGTEQKSNNNVHNRNSIINKCTPNENSIINI